MKPRSWQDVGPDSCQIAQLRAAAAVTAAAPRSVYFSSHAAPKMLLPSGICRKPCTFLLSATG